MKIVTSENFKKLALKDLNDFHGMKPDIDEKKSQPSQLFDKQEEPVTDDQVIEEWNNTKKEEGKLIYQNGIKIPK